MANAVTLNLWMAARLTLRGGRGFSRFVGWVSVIGLTLGVMSLTAVMAVMNGFDQELKQRLLGSVPHITLANAQPTNGLLEFAQTDTRVRQIGPYFQGFGVITQSGRAQPVTAIALTEAGFKAQPQLLNALSEGALALLEETPNGILMGAPLARALGTFPGDSLNLLLTVPRGESLGSTVLRAKVVGTFELGADPDYGLLLMSLAAKPMDTWGQLGQTGMRLQLHNALDAQSLVNSLAEAPNLWQGQSEVVISSWVDEYGDLFQAVALEKTLMGTLLLLVIAIAGFNIVAGQLMMVSDKRADIAILRTMGADQSLVRNVFLLQGSLVGLVGTITGLAVGVLLAQYVNEIVDALEWLTGRHLLDGSYFVKVPSQIKGTDLLLTGLAAGGLAVWSAWLPAHRASQMNPLENLKV
jgi:lipoprotein-releasing system permease protein